jgi:SAM-dependent methyltransferase
MTPTPPRNQQAHQFWEERYAGDPELGSGVGSKGPWKQRKLDILSQVLRRHRIRRVLDLGCGDLQVLRDLPQLGELEYTGIDFSAEVIARNRVEFPRLRFIHADLGDVESLAVEPPDLVICFDVLFHIEDPGTYQSLCRYMFNSGARALVLTCAVGRTDTNGVNLWYYDFWREGQALGLAYLRKIERGFRLPYERLIAFDLAESGRDLPTEVVYMCSPDREEQLRASIGSLLRSGTSFDRVAVFWIGDRPPPCFGDPRIAVIPSPPLFGDYFFGNKVYLCTRRAARVVFLDTDTFVLRPLDLLWEGERADFLARVGTSYGEAGWDRAAWDLALAAAGGAETPMYNCGLLVFQNQAHRRIREDWEKQIWRYLRAELPRPWPDERMPEQWALAFALAAGTVSQAALGPGQHAFGWAGDPWSRAVVLHTGIGDYARYRDELGPDAAPLADAGDGSELPARAFLLERELTALEASRTLALGRLAVGVARLLVSLLRLDTGEARNHWRTVRSSTRLLTCPPGAH